MTIHKLIPMIALMAVSAAFCSPCHADLILTSVGMAVTDDFDSYRGDGYAPVPTGTQLDSNTYRMTGLSDGDGAFGGTHTTGDFARGSSTGGVTTGGNYGFDVGGGNFGVGIQPTGADATPGSFTIRVLNSTGVALNRIDFLGDGYVLNDQERSTRWTFELSLDDVNYNPIFVLDSPEASDLTPEWILNPIVGSFTSPISVANGQQFYVRLTGSDLAGSGSRDEFSLGGISITGSIAIPEPGTISLTLIAGAGLLTARRRRS